MDRADTFDDTFHRAERRFRWRAALRAAALALPWLQAAWVAVYVLARFARADLSLPVVLTALTVVLAAAVAWGVFRSPAGRDAALVLDRRLATRELLTTAYEAGAWQEGGSPLARLARQRASAALAASAVATALPLVAWRSWRPTWVSTVFVVAAFLLPLPAPEAEATPTVDPAVTRAAAELAQELAPLAEEVTELDRDEAVDALRHFQEVADAMRSGEIATTEAALVALSAMEQELAELREGAAQDSLGDSELTELVRDLGSDPLSAEMARAMTAGDRAALRQALDRMAEAVDAGEARDAARQQELSRLAERLERLARHLDKRGEGELAETLRELAEALRTGDLKRASELLGSEEVALACEKGGRLSKGSNMATTLARLVDLGRFHLGQTPLQGPGAEAGRGSTNEEVEGKKTGGPNLKNRQSDATSDRQGSFEALYDSRLRRAEDSLDLRVSGQVGEKGELLSEPGLALGTVGEGSLPLRPLPAGTAGADEQAVDLEDVPLGYRQLIRTYFDRQEQKEDSDG
jgi:hypothetical protein